MRQINNTHLIEHFDVNITPVQTQPNGAMTRLQDAKIQIVHFN